MGDPEDYSIAREGVWGREGLAAAAPTQAGGFILNVREHVRLQGKIDIFQCSLVLFLGAVWWRSWGGLGAFWGRSWGILGRS